jgi:hypothetical protein
MAHLTCRSCGQPLPAGSSRDRRLCDHCRGLARPERCHLVTTCRLHDYGPSWLRCRCGLRLRAPNAAGLAEAFAVHVRETGIGAARGARSRRVSSLGLPDPSGTYRPSATENQLGSADA